METAIKKADKKITYVSADPEAMRLYEMREMAMFDYTSGINAAKTEGIAEGENKKAIEIAKNMLREGSPVAFISKTTGLDEPTILSLQAEVNAA